MLITRAHSITKNRKRVGSGCTGTIVKQTNVPHKQQCYRSNQTEINNDAKVRDHRKDTNNNSNNDSHDHQDNQCDDVRYPPYFIDGCKNGRYVKRLTDTSVRAKRTIPITSKTAMMIARTNMTMMPRAIAPNAAIIAE